MALPGRPPLDAEDETQRVTIRVPGTLREAATAEAERRGVTVSEAMRQALALWLTTPADTEAA